MDDFDRRQYNRSILSIAQAGDEAAGGGGGQGATVAKVTPLPSVARYIYLARHAKTNEGTRASAKPVKWSDDWLKHFPFM